MSALGMPDRHPALKCRVVARDRFPRREKTEEGGIRLGLSPAEALKDLPVNYYGRLGPRRKSLRQMVAPHTMFMGTTGSGKTLAMKLHMMSVLPPAFPGFDMNFRSLVYDAKTDMLPFIAQMGLNTDAHVILTNPFDKRSVAWDISYDIDNPADSQALADIIVQEGTGDAFWQVAAREMVSSVIDGLNTPLPARPAPFRWTLRHLVLVMDTPALLSQVLERTPKGRGVKRDYTEAKDNRLQASLNATLRSHITPYRLIAALWDRATAAFSMKEWLEGGGMLLVGDHYKYKDTMVRLNNALVRYAIDTLMDRQGEERLDLTWLYLDELKNAGKFPNFGTMLTQGRSKGIRSVLAAQGLSTLKATFAEGEEQEVLNNTGNKAIMQLASDEDAKWAERLFSTAMVIQESITRPEDRPGPASVTQSKVRESRVDASEFMDLPSASQQNGAITAFYRGPGAEAWHSTLSAEALRAALPRTELDSTLPDSFDPRDKLQYELRPMRDEDYAHLGLGPKDGEASERRFRLPPAPVLN